MKKKIIITIIIYATFFIACRKITRETNVSGNVYDATSMAPLAHVKVSLMAKNESALGGRPSAVKDTYTDVDGGFVFNFRAEKTNDYSVEASESRYQTTGGDVEKFKNNKNIKLIMPRSSFLKIHVKNTSPFDVNDAIGVTANYAWPPPFNFFGTTVDTYVISKGVGDNNCIVSWYVSKNSTNTNFNDTVYCPAFDTTLYNLNY
jgi:hypothetical protein